MPLLHVVRMGDQEEITVRFRIKDSTLGTANSVRDERLVEDGIAKLDPLGFG
jgi:hypothetical protein